MGKLDGKVAIVTGAASGMGRATAVLLASEGAKVVVADIDEAGAAETVSLIAADGGDAVAVGGDTSVNKDVQQIVGTALSAYGRIDALHNNAGILRTFPSIEEHSEEVWRRVVDVNLTGYFLLSRAVLPLMRAAGGAIVNTMGLLDPSDVARLVLYFITHPDMTGQAIAANWVEGKARYHYVTSPSRTGSW